MAAAMCQALPSFYSDFCQSSLSISVSSDFYVNYIETNYFCVSIHNSHCSLKNCKFHILLIDSSFDQVLQQLATFRLTYQIIGYFTLCTNTDFFRKLFHQLANFSVNLTALFITI